MEWGGRWGDVLDPAHEFEKVPVKEESKVGKVPVKQKSKSEKVAVIKKSENACHPSEGFYLEKLIAFSFI